MHLPNGSPPSPTGPNVSISWFPRTSPLPPCAIVARGPSATALARRLLACDDAVLLRLAGVSARGFLLILAKGDPTDLPWVDGALYLGKDPEAATLLLPTVRRPSVPVSLLERAVRKQFSELPSPIALIPDWGLILTVQTARSVAREMLEHWLQAEEAGV